jgi:formiminotetrahydrofolate cyclodeaminase
MLAKNTLEEFTTQLAAGTPTPGGGSAAALAGALAASLLKMVCELTVGREKYRAHDEAVRAIREKAGRMRVDLLAQVDRDAAAYDEVMRAIRMPKEDDEQKRTRAAALQKANLFATETPMAVAEACAALMGLAVELSRKGNPNALSDVGTAALLAYAGLRGGAMNVRINLPGIKDAELAAKARERILLLEAEGERLREESLAAVVPAGGPGS